MVLWCLDIDFYCQCGCGEEVVVGKKYVSGHNMKGRVFSEETRAKLSISKKGKRNPQFKKVRSEDYRKKLSLAGSCRRHSDETKNKISLSHKGEKNPSWYGGISKVSYGPGNDEDLKEFIRVRDNYACQECGVVWIKGENKFHPHHIDYDKNNHSLWNRITLCNSCHSKTNNNREYWEKHLYEKNFKNCIERILNA